MIIQTAPTAQPRLAIMMYEHTALAHQFARAFGNRSFQAPEPLDLVCYVVEHHDAGWAEFDRNPATDPASDLPYNLVETPAEHITVTPVAGVQRAPSSLHRPVVEHAQLGPVQRSLRPLQHGADRQDRSAGATAGRADAGWRASAAEAAQGGACQDPAAAAWLDERHVFQNYKQLQFFDLLALYFNRTHASERGELKFDHVPLNAREDVTITVRPAGDGVYSLLPYPFTAEGASFAYAGRPVTPGQQDGGGRWTGALAAAPTVWETFRLVAA